MGIGRVRHGWVGYREHRCRCAKCCAAYIAKMKERREQEDKQRVAKRKQRTMPVVYGWDSLTKAQYDKERDAASPVRRAQPRGGL